MSRRRGKKPPRTAVFDMQDFLQSFYRTRAKGTFSVAVDEEVDWDSVPPSMLFVTACVEQGGEGEEEREYPWITLLVEEGDCSADNPKCRKACIPKILSATYDRSEAVAVLECEEVHLDDLKITQTPFFHIQFNCLHDLENVERWVQDYCKDAVEAAVREQAAASSGGAPPPRAAFSSLAPSAGSSVMPKSSFQGVSSMGSISGFSRGFFETKSGLSFMKERKRYSEWNPDEIMEWVKSVFVTRRDAHQVEQTLDDGSVLVEEYYDDATTLDQLMTREELMALESYLRPMHGMIHLLENIGHFRNGQDYDEGLAVVLANEMFVETVLEETREMREFGRDRFNPDFHGVLKKKLRPGRRPIEYGEVEIVQGVKTRRVLMKSVERVKYELRTLLKSRILWDAPEFGRQIQFSILFRLPLLKLINEVGRFANQLQRKLRRPQTFMDSLNSVRKQFSRRTLQLFDEEDEEDEEEEPTYVEPLIEIESLSYRVWRIVEMYKCKQALIDASILVTGEAAKTRIEEMLAEAETDLRSSQAAVKSRGRRKKIQASELMTLLERYEGLDSLGRVSKFDPMAMAFKTEFAMSETRSNAFEAINLMGLQVKLDSMPGRAGNIPVKLILSKFMKDTALVGTGKGKMLSVFLPIAQRMFGVGAPFGYFHALFAYGNCRFEWNANGLVRFQMLEDDDDYRELICVSLVSPRMQVFTERTFPVNVLTLAQALVTHNSEQDYAAAFGGGRKENCQEFALKLIKGVMEVESLPRLVEEFVWKASKVSLTEDPEATLNQALIFTGSDAFRSQFRSEGGVLGEEEVLFTSHDQLDEFVEALSHADRRWTSTYVEEFEYLKAMDRAFWIREYKAEGKPARDPNSCPFNRMDASDLESYLGELPQPDDEEEEEEEEEEEGEEEGEEDAWYM